MTTERIEEIAARLNAATKGPWKFKEYEYGYSGLEGGDGEYIFYPDGYNDGDRPITWLGEEMTEVNRVMIENAPDDIRDLLAEVERLRERAVKLEGLLSEALDDAPGWILDAEAALE